MELTKKILDAQVYALKAHEHKTYGEGIPYAVHVIFVVSIIQKFIHLIPEDEREDVICAAWLHDVREDHGVSYNEIKKLFGLRVAEIVYSVTNEDGRDREEKAIKTYPKTAKNRLSVFVKLGDRTANTLYSFMSKSGMYKKYVKEYDYFNEILYKEGEYEEFWNFLKEAVDKKSTYYLTV